MALLWVLIPAIAAVLAIWLMSATAGRRVRSTPTPAELGDLLSDASDKVTRSDRGRGDDAP